MKSKNNRGFEQLIGKTIKRINASAINCVYIEDTDGQVYEIEAESQHLNIPIISLNKFLMPWLKR